MWQAALGTCGLSGQQLSEEASRRPQNAVSRLPPPAAQALLPHLMAWSGPQGFSSSSTAAEVTDRFGCKGTVLLTGATSSLGRALCHALAKQGAHLVLGCRDPTAAQALVQELHQTEPSCKAQVLHCDLSSVKTAAESAAAFKALGLPLNVLILSASTTAPAFALSQDGIEQQFMTNHLAQCVLAQALLPLLLQTAAQEKQRDEARGRDDVEFKREEGSAGGTADADKEGSSEASARRPPDAGGEEASCSGQQAPFEDLQAHPLEPEMRCGRSHYGRIVFVSCSTHYLSYKFLRGGRTPGVWRSMVEGNAAARMFMPVQGFALSKLAQLLYMHHLAHLLDCSSAHVVVHAVHPGLTQEGLNRFGGFQSGSWLGFAQQYLTSSLRAAGMLKSPEQAAASVAFAVAAPISLMAIASQEAQSTPPGLQQQEQKREQEAQRLSLSGRYIEDCRLSLPSSEARDQVAASAVWQVTQDLIAERLPGVELIDAVTKAVLSIS